MRQSFLRGALLLGCFALLPACASADAAGEALLKKCVDAESRTHTLQADFVFQIHNGGQATTARGSLTVKKPNIGHIVYKVGGTARESAIIHSDGNTLYRYFPADNAYIKRPTDMTGGNVGNLRARIFFTPDTLNQFRGQGTGAKIVGKLTVGGAICKKLQILGVGQGTTYQFYIGQDGLLRGLRVAAPGSDGAFVEEDTFTDLRIDASLSRAALTWTLPKGARSQEEIASAASNAGANQNEEEQSLLPVGKKAPDFELPTLTGGKVTLSSVCRPNRATLLIFWSNFCPACHAELPQINAMLTQLKGKGFDVLTINSGDDDATIQKFWKASGFTMPGAFKGDSVAEKYHVLAIPTNYIIGSNGKILAHFEGFDEDGIRGTLAQAGVK